MDVLESFRLMGKIAEFVEYGDCVVIKQADWDRLAWWIKETKDLNGLPNFDLMPVSFRPIISKQEDATTDG